MPTNISICIILNSLNMYIIFSVFSCRSNVYHSNGINLSLFVYVGQIITTPMWRRCYFFRFSLKTCAHVAYYYAYLRYNECVFVCYFMQKQRTVDGFGGSYMAGNDTLLTNQLTNLTDHLIKRMKHFCYFRLIVAAFLIKS